MDRFQRMKWFPLFSISLFLLLSPVSTWAAEKRVEEVRKELALNGRGLLEVKNKRGDIRIAGDPKMDSILLRVVKTVRTGSDEEADAILSGLSFEVELTDSSIRIVSHYPKEARKRGILGFFSRMTRRVTMDYYIDVPADLRVSVAGGRGDVAVARIGGDVRVNCSSGDVEVEEAGDGVTVAAASGDSRVSAVRGNLRITSASGDIVAEHVEGSLVATTASGDIEVRDVARDARVTASSGDVSLSLCGGDVQASSTSGDVDLEAVDGSIVASTSSGDIGAEFVPLEGRQFIFATASGDVGLRYLTPPGYGFVLEISTGSGSISAEMEISIEKVTRRYLKGVVASGAATVKISSGSGSINLEKVAQRVENR